MRSNEYCQGQACVYETSQIGENAKLSYNVFKYMYERVTVQIYISHL